MFAVASFFLICVAAFGQRDLGTITGTITDAQGAVVPNAKLTLTEDATGVSYNIQSNESGSFTRPALKAGTYTLIIEASGFQKSQRKNILINPGEPTAINIALQVGNSTQTVEVTASAPLLQTETPTIGATLNTAQITQLPLGGQRTFTFLARLSPGVVVAEQGARDSLNGGFSANGVRSSGENNYLLNGVDNNVNVIDFINQAAYVIGPSVEAIGEMSVTTTGNNAEYGRAAGGVVNINLKSGTNQIHGVLFEILQNNLLNANRWENNLAGQPTNPVRQNQFGAAIGGPIIKNKLFIFGDYQGTRVATAGGTIQNLGYGGFYTIPTQAMINGDFSGLLGSNIGNGVLQNQLYDPRNTSCPTPATCTRVPFVGNRIPTSLMDPASLKIASLYPQVNVPSGVRQGFQPQNDYYVVTPGILNTDQGDGRVDYHLSDTTSIFGSISWSNTSKSSGTPFAGLLDGGTFNGQSEQDLGRNAMLSVTHLWSPSLVSETRVAFSRLVTARTQANSATDAFSAVGIGGFNPTNIALNGGLPQIQLGSSATSAYSQIGANDWLPTKEYNNVWDFIQNVSLNKGTHSLKFGFEFRPIRFPFFQVPYPHGEMNFSRNETAYPSAEKDAGGRSGTFAADTGDEVASFLLGAINNGQISTTNFISSTKKAYAAYIQDDWKVTSKLTLNLGVRYELFSPIGEQFGRQSNYDQQNTTLYIPAGPNQNAPLPPNFNAPVTLNGQTYPALFSTPITVSRGQVSQYLIPWDKLDIGPRIGLAYSINDKTVVRAAYGVFYGGEENQGGSPNRGEAAPFNESPQLNRPAGVSAFQPDPAFANGAATGGVSVGFPTNVFTTFPVSSLQFRSIAQDFRNPMVQKWNLAVQHQFAGQMALEVSYVGNHSSHQLLQPDPNACPNLGTTNTSINCNSLRLYPDIGGVSGTASFGYGNYDGMTVKLEKRMSNGLQFINSYTYGHALANSGTPLSGSTNLYTKDPTNFATSYTNASWDIRHNFTSGFSYDIPFGHGKSYGANLNRAMNTLLGNWQLNGILTLHTGQPYTLKALTSSCQGVWGGGTNCSPDLVAGKDANAAPAGGRSPSAWFDTANVTSPAPLTGGNLGLQTNYGPPVRTLDFSIFKNFVFTERFALQFRTEGTNVANTPQFSLPDATLGDAKFGQVTSTNVGSERHIQFALRLQF
ncbi:MAG TPA: TonB-dependent receptor [Bryobacteraceae bacterium]|nr:TonB-dependent receptor [Bryobacteraceae bacterium]